MAENKTKRTAVSPHSFIELISNEQRRSDCLELIGLMQDITGHPPRMWGPSIVGFDQYHYTYESGREGDMLLTGFSPRKQDLVLYLGPGLDNKGLLAKLGKHKAGKGCLYVKRLDDVSRPVLRDLIEKSVAAMRKRHQDTNA
jgi:Domain of unknown function (DU1801)